MESSSQLSQEIPPEQWLLQYEIYQPSPVEDSSSSEEDQPIEPPPTIKPKYLDSSASKGKQLNASTKSGPKKLNNENLK